MGNAPRSNGCPVVGHWTKQHAHPLADVAARRVASELGGMEIPVIGLVDLLSLKHAVGRPQDVADIAELRHLYPDIEWTPPTPPAASPDQHPASSIIERWNTIEHADTPTPPIDGPDISF